MKPKTKKTLIILVAVVMVAAIIYFAFIRKNGKNVSGSMINKLGLNEADAQKLKEAVAAVEAYAEAHPEGESTDGWAKNNIEAAAQQQGCTYAQMVLIHAAYAAFGEANFAQLKAKILAL